MGGQSNAEWFSHQRKYGPGSRECANAEPIKWDENNILETLHPTDKDYGLMKIDEPKTPFSYYEEDSGAEGSNVECGGETSKIELSTIMKNIDRPAKILISSEPSDDSDDENLSKEERRKKKEFEFKRKLHYNEYQALKLARKLLEEEDDEDDENNSKSNEEKSKKSEESTNSKDAMEEQ
ncbi:hypothetical protein RND71_044005 [Anisodus tanguticus]|uniref:Protein phosphatase inhibitor 2 n=1 Tax=Anisodus tanguticus TaxID=243964 RepID=A0AAE1UTX2_9SOLA|nr:hypothetical protein RND71_044005 [Anisodus tanguticus]